jgi:hypothetical protein
MQNLRDKLLKAGLVSADQAQEAATPPKPVERPPPPRRDGARADAPSRPPQLGLHSQPRPSGRASTAGPLIAVRREPLPPSIPKLPPLPGSREAQRLESRKQLDMDRELRERVSAAAVALAPGERTFYFVTRKNRLRRLELSVEQATGLESGALAVVERPEPGQIEHALVPAAAAEGLLRDFPRAVRFFNREGEPVGFLSEDDLHARQKTEAEEPKAVLEAPPEAAAAPPASGEGSSP